MSFANPSRLLDIYNRVAILARASKYPADFASQDDVLLLANQCTEDLVKKGVFIVTDTMDCTADTAAYDYPTDAFEMVDMWWTETKIRFRKINTEREYQYLQAVSSVATADSPWARYFTRDQIYVWPTPGSTVVDGFTVRYKFLPDAMTGSGSTGCTPPTPPGYDEVYDYYILKTLTIAKRGLTKQESMAMYWDQQYRKAVAELLRQGMSL